MEFVRAGYRLRSVILTPKMAYITFSKQVEVKEPKGYLAVARKRIVQRRYHGDRHVLGKAMSNMKRNRVQHPAVQQNPSTGGVPFRET